VERAGAKFAASRDTCSTFRGRLPTASELHRVSATESAAIGKPADTNRLWSLAPWGGAAHATVRLSDGQPEREPDDASVNFRCACPPALPKAYVASKCFGPTGAGCFTLKDEDSRRNVDVDDRPSLPKAGALWECGFYGGHLPRTLDLAEAIQQGIGPGSNMWLQSADEVGGEASALARWTDGSKFVFHTTTDGSESLSLQDDLTPAPFRCAGSNVAAEPSTIAAADSPQATFIDATDQCVKSGGHVPAAGELGELIVGGLAGGTNNLVWTSDETGTDNTDLTVAVVKWTDTSFLAGPPDVASERKSANMHPYRCIRYPVDASYGGPPASSCAAPGFGTGSACFALTVSSSSGAMIWVDSFDRPQATATAAIDACRRAGGHLPSARDLTEAIRAGLPNGQDAFLHTSDLVRSAVGAASLSVSLVKWRAIQPAFDDSAPTYAGTGRDEDLRPYRCVWTNEVR
jgi:hypothetical protein